MTGDHDVIWIVNAVRPNIGIRYCETKRIQVIDRFTTRSNFDRFVLIRIFWVPKIKLCSRKLKAIKTVVAFVVPPYP